MHSTALVQARELARRVGVSVPTISYYTNLGILEVVERKGNLRLYDGKVSQQKIDHIRRLLAQGYTLKLIRELSVSGKL